MKNFVAIKNALLYSIDGVKFLLGERAFRQELELGFCLFIVEFFRDSTLAIRTYLFTAYIIVLIAEALNTAVEKVVDRIGPQRHELSKQAKDVGSAVVFIALVHLGIVWILSWVV